MSRVEAFLRFLWDFVVGDDWRIALGVVDRDRGHRAGGGDERGGVVDPARGGGGAARGVGVARGGAVARRGVGISSAKWQKIPKPSGGRG